MKFELLNSQQIYKGRIFELRIEHVKLPNGHQANLDIIRHPGAVVILPVDSLNNVLFICQYRHAAGVELLELPAGMLEPGENQDECALREIREEIGMAAGRLINLGDFYLAPGYSSEHLYIYLASDLSHSPLPRDHDEFIHIQPVSVRDAYKMAETGVIKDAKTLATLMLARPYLFQAIID